MKPSDAGYTVIVRGIQCLKIVEKMLSAKHREKLSLIIDGYEVWMEDAEPVSFNLLLQDLCLAVELLEEAT